MVNKDCYDRWDKICNSDAVLCHIGIYQTTLLQVKNRACDSVGELNTKLKVIFMQILENIEVKWWVLRHGNGLKTVMF